MHLIVLTGAATAAKMSLTAGLARSLVAAGRSVTILDNGDRPLHLAEAPTIRLAGGCVCCSLAARLRPTVERIAANLAVDLALLTVSALADPALLAQTLDRLRGAVETITTVAVADPLSHSGYLARQIAAHADLTVDASRPVDETLAAILKRTREP